MNQFPNRHTYVLANHVLLSCAYHAPDKIKSLKRFYIKRVKDLHKEAQVFEEKDLMKSLRQSPCVPEVLCTCADQSYLGILLNCCLCCSLASILHTPLNESSAQFYAASVVVALEKLHQVRFCFSLLIGIRKFVYMWFLFMR